MGLRKGKSSLLGLKHSSLVWEPRFLVIGPSLWRLYFSGIHEYACISLSVALEIPSVLFGSLIGLDPYCVISISVLLICVMCLSFATVRSILYDYFYTLLVPFFGGGRNILEQSWSFYEQLNLTNGAAVQAFYCLTNLRIGIVFLCFRLTKTFYFLLGIEARGFIFGPPIALAIGAKFVPLRKPRKLPGNIYFFPPASSGLKFLRF